MFCFSPVPAPSASGDQERAELAAGRRHLEARQALYAELQTQLDNCPESVREQLQEQLRRVSFTSPPPRPRGPPARKRGAVGRERPGPAVPAGRQGRCCGLEGTGKDGRVGDGGSPFCCCRPRCPGKRQGRAEEREQGGGRAPPPFPRVQPPELSPLWPGLPGAEWDREHHPTPFCHCHSRRPRPWRRRRSSSRTWSSSSWSGRAAWRKSASWRARGCSGARPNCSAASPRGRCARPIPGSAGLTSPG